MPNDLMKPGRGGKATPAQVVASVKDLSAMASAAH